LFLEFPPEGKNETLIIIASFYHTGGVTDTEAHNEIKQAIEKAKAELGFANLRVQVEPAHLQADDRAGAEALGKRYHASIVIWGADTGVRVMVNFLSSRNQDFTPPRSRSARPSAPNWRTQALTRALWPRICPANSLSCPSLRSDSPTIRRSNTTTASKRLKRQLRP
jgi:hypothetical protein